MLSSLVLSVFATITSLISTSPPALGSSSGPAPELQRGAFFGAKVSAVPDEVREKWKLEEGMGAVIETVFPESTAEAAGFKAGDVLLTLDGAKIAGAGDAVQKISARKAGTQMTIEFRRGDTLDKKAITLKGRPFEKSDAYEVEYASVPTRGGQLRTILTRPKGDGKHPALFFIQGVGLYSIDNPVGPLASHRIIVDDFARRGFVTLRVDKPGCGDSEGGPARDVDFDTELDGYRQALNMLKTRTDVDADRVFLFGHSMGGVMAPLLAAENPVRGIIVYGTITRTWTEYMLENVRRQRELADNDPSEIDRDLRIDAALWTHLLLEKVAPKDIVTRYPHLRERLEQTITEDKYLVDRSLTFFRQLADKNLGAAWETFGGHALAIWGKADFVSNEDDHALIARIVNRDHPGRGTFLALEGTDHGLNRAATPRESFQRGQSQEPGQFNPAILEVCRTWVDKTLSIPANPAKRAG
jgi:pimeloyl-ACP methyl ester carboxylesterase